MKNTKGLLSLIVIVLVVGFFGCKGCMGCMGAMKKETVTAKVQELVSQPNISQQ